MKKPIFSEAARLVILNEIFEHFQQMTQWDIRHPCGSAGGFDYTNPMERLSNFGQYDRFLALVRKYHKYQDIECVCGFSVENLIDMFKKFGNIRDKYENE